MSPSRRTGSTNSRSRDRGELKFNQQGLGANGDAPPACAECRRVKRRCSRVWPCQSCVRRGCGSICPNGTLTPGGGGNRYILHGSEQLHRRIKEMSTRIGQLEDALAALWVGSEEHPLLRRELLGVKIPPDTQNLSNNILEDDADAGDEEDIDEGVLANEFDALALGVGLGGGLNGDGIPSSERNRGERLGISTIEFILNTEEKSHTPNPPTTAFSSGANADIDGTRLPLAPSIIKLSESFPSAAAKDSMIDLSTLLLYLPPLQLAIRLCKSYFENAGWTYGAIDYQTILCEVLPIYYPQHTQANHQSIPQRPDMTPNAHVLALLNMIFAVGAIVDLQVPSVADQAERYHTLAQASICLKSPLFGGSITLVEVLSFMITYSYMWDRDEVKMDRVAVIMALASKWGLTMGLHRDCARLNLPAKEVQRRRFVFWELFTTNVWQSLSSGRPSFLQMLHMDCLPPSDPGPRIASDGQTVIRHPHDFDKFRFTREILCPIIESNFNLTKPINYAAILALDRKVRDFEHADTSRAMNAVNNPTMGMEMQTHASSHVKEHVMLHLHRAFFAHAMMHNPESPLDSPYATSVLATFKCAVTLLEGVNAIYLKLPEQVIPYGLSWSDVLTSAVAMGTICSKGARGSLAPVAYTHLKMAVSLVESKFAVQARAKSGLPVLYKLQEEAHKAIAAVGPGPSSSIPFSPTQAALSIQTDIGAHGVAKRDDSGSSSARPFSTPPTSATSTSDAHASALALFENVLRQPHDPTMQAHAQALINGRPRDSSRGRMGYSMTPVDLGPTYSTMPTHESLLLSPTSSTHESQYSPQHGDLNQAQNLQNFDWTFPGFPGPAVDLGMDTSGMNMNLDTGFPSGTKWNNMTYEPPNNQWPLHPQ